jgi:predicted nucleotidyltransferase
MVAHGIDLDSPAIHEFCRKWKITELSVFGSILRDEFGPDSDVDFLVSWDRRARWDAFDHIQMEEELAKIVGRRVDLVARGAVEISENRFRKHHILSTAESVFAKR